MSRSGRSDFKPLRQGAIYFALVFALGFVLGTVRVLWLVPVMGETNAVLAELPIMLAASWFAARWLLRDSTATSRERAVMGAVAFALLMAADFALAVVAFDQTPREWAARLLVMPGPVGLAGQIAFAAMPMFVERRRA